MIEEREPSIGERLAHDGRVVMLVTRGRVSGRAARAAVGFIEEPDGCLLVAAGDPDAQWARNLAADPRCTATWGDRSGAFRAEVLTGNDLSTAITALILRYGTPAERLGRGPAFRLRPGAGKSPWPPDPMRADPSPTDA